jgi:hypothetical protein
MTVTASKRGSQTNRESDGSRQRWEHEPWILKAEFFVYEPVQIPRMVSEPFLDRGQFAHQLRASFPPANVQNVAGARDATDLATGVETICLDHPPSSRTQTRIAAGVVTDDRRGVLQFEFVVVPDGPDESPVQHHWLNDRSQRE